MRHTCFETSTGIPHPFLPHLGISPIWVKFGEGPAIINGLVPFVPDGVWSIGVRRGQVRKSHMHASTCPDSSG
jgi:hypothetical protein